MNYELAKKLKDAGFPVGTKGFWLEEDCDGCGFHNEYVPTLSELIEACGEQFGELVSLGEGGDHQWYAADKDDAVGRNYGAIPEIAAARLWLALHPKP